MTGSGRQRPSSGEIFELFFNQPLIPRRWRLDCQDRIGIVTGYEIVYCSIRDEMDVDKICAGRNLTQEIPRPDAEKSNLTNLTPYTPYKVENLIIIPTGSPRTRFSMKIENQLKIPRSWCE